MAVEKSKKVQVKVSMPKELHQQLKDISEATGIPMSTIQISGGRQPLRLHQRIETVRCI